MRPRPLCQKPRTRLQSARRAEDRTFPRQVQRPSCRTQLWRSRGGGWEWAQGGRAGEGEGLGRAGGIGLVGQERLLRAEGSHQQVVTML